MGYERSLIKESTYYLSMAYFNIRLTAFGTIEDIHNRIKKTAPSQKKFI